MRSEDQSCDDPTAVGNAAGRRDRGWSGEVHGQRHEHQSRHPSRVSTGLRALRHQDISTGLEGNLSGVNIANRLDPDDAAVMRMSDEIARNAHVE